MYSYDLNNCFLQRSKHKLEPFDPRTLAIYCSRQLRDAPGPVPVANEQLKEQILAGLQTIAGQLAADFQTQAELEFRAYQESLNVAYELDAGEIGARSGSLTNLVRY